MTVIGFFLTFILAMWITPHLNAKFEAQKIKTQFVIDNLRSFNDNTQNLVGDVSLITNHYAKNKILLNDELQSLNGTLTKLHWKAIELQIIFADSPSSSIITTYQKNLNALKLNINQIETIGIDPVKMTTKDVLTNSHQIVSELAKIGGINISKQHDQ